MYQDIGSPASVRERILSTAYRRAQEQGLGSVNIRSVAQECAVSVGTIYNHFPDKASLVTEVIERFWERAARSNGGACFDYVPGENLIVYCRRVAAGLAEALAEFRSDWLGEVYTLDARTRARGHEAEKSRFLHIEHSFETVIRNDAGIDQATLERIGAAELAHLMWQSMLESLKAGDAECRTLLTLVECALYK